MQDAKLRLFDLKTSGRSLGSLYKWNFRKKKISKKKSISNFKKKIKSSVLKCNNVIKNKKKFFQIFKRLIYFKKKCLVIPKSLHCISILKVKNKNILKDIFYFKLFLLKLREEINFNFF
ncbi:hypothetical protein (nucleomorph) [Guillardia theta]|uniref:Uncharacterized protein n=1 Tax=Guillardia theta TaxID=55529 RepID=Q98S52_GUITH|nr:hypothetical protein GTHECHR3086 [Guillardia theta]AAK39730.1 hypothetical protein [Guillardia theta]